jgi:hypothetical protein
MATSQLVRSAHPTLNREVFHISYPASGLPHEGSTGLIFIEAVPPTLAPSQDLTSAGGPMQSPSSDEHPAPVLS